MRNITAKLFVIFLLLFSSSAYAGKWLELFAGMATSMLVHELSHELVARAYGDELRWEGLAWSCQRCSSNHIKPIAIAGLASNIISSEILLWRKQNAFARGWLAFNIISESQYLLGASGDLGNFNDRERISIGAASFIHAVSVSQRAQLVYITRDGIHFKLFF